MKELAASDAFFSDVHKGLAWAVADLPSGRIESGRIATARGSVRLFADKALADTDGFALGADDKGLKVSAGRPRAFLAGILNLAEKLRGGRDYVEAIIPRFTSRLYKHEANILGSGDSAFRAHAPVGDLDEAFWVPYVKALVRKHFTGLVFYAHYHPFEYYLDYEEFPEAPAPSKRDRARTLAGLKRAFGVARAFGLDTFMQHYLTHFPHGLAKAHNIIRNYTWW